MRRDVETYVYEPKGGAQALQIDNYEAKRNRLQGEILRRRDQLAFAHYEYVGRRGRRDPWVDPRVLVNQNPDDEVWTIEQQIAYVEAMIESVEQGEQLMQEMLGAESFVENARLSRDLQDALAYVEGEVRRMDAVGVLSFHNAEQEVEVGSNSAVVGGALSERAIWELRGLFLPLSRASRPSAATNQP